MVTMKSFRCVNEWCNNSYRGEADKDPVPCRTCQIELRLTKIEKLLEELKPKK